MRWFTSLIILAAASTPIFAGAEVSVRSATQARVFFDDQEIGATPIRIRDVDPGFHEVRVESVQSGESRVYEFYSPRNTTVTKNIDADFGRAAYDDVTYQGQDEAGYAVAGDDEVAPEAYEEAADRSYEEGKRDQKERTKVRVRNTVLGAGLLNELLNKGSSKKTIRNTALGGILLNEIINR